MAHNCIVIKLLFFLMESHDKVMKYLFIYFNFRLILNLRIGCRRVLYRGKQSALWWRRDNSFLLSGDLFWGDRPVHPRGGVALLAALLQLRLHLGGARGLEASETHRVPGDPAEEVRPSTCSVAPTACRYIINVHFVSSTSCTPDTPSNMWSLKVRSD